MDGGRTDAEYSLSDLSNIVKRIDKSNEDVDNRIFALRKQIENILEQEQGILNPINKIKNNLILLEHLNVCKNEHLLKRHT